MRLGVVGVAAGGEPADGQLDPGLELGRSAGVQDDVVHAPVVLHDRETALGADQQHRDVGAGRADQPAQVACVGEVLAAVDEEQVGVRRLEQRAALGGQDPDLVAEQGQAGQDLGGRLQGAGEKQERAHDWSPPMTGRGPKRNAGLRPVVLIVNNTEHGSLPDRSPLLGRCTRGGRRARGRPGGRRPITLAEVVERALALHPGTRLPDVLKICSTLVGDRPVNAEDPDQVLVAPGSSVEFLPPFAGG